MGRKPVALTLLPEERDYLETTARTRTLQAQVVLRARILLLKADGYSIEAIADKVDMNRKSVMLCIDKYKAGGVQNALTDAPGRGRNAEITEEEKAWIISLAKQHPSKHGYSAKRWSYARLTEHLHRTAEAAGYLRLSTIHKTTVNTILDEAGIKLHRMTYETQEV